MLGYLRGRVGQGEKTSHTTHAGFRNEDAVNESDPYPELQEGSPDSNLDGHAQELA